KAGGFNVRASKKNYNNEIGIPFTVIGKEVHGMNLREWVELEFEAYKLLFRRDPNYPKLLILEMGVDHPGDIQYLVKLAPAHIGIVTAIGDDVPVHIEFFKDKEQLVREKRQMVEHLKKEDVAILNRDDLQVWGMRDKARGRVVSVGMHPEADIRALEIQPTNAFADEYNQAVTGLSYKLQAQGSLMPIFLPHALGMPQVLASLFAVAVGLEHGMNLVDIASALREFHPPAGRTNLIPGIKHTLIVDDSYNSSPKACKSALELLGQVKVAGRRIAVLGDMAELGRFTESAHAEVGRLVTELKIDSLVTVGQKADFIALAAVAAGMDERAVVKFSKPEEAGKFVQSELREGDVILVKGSQSARMEKVVKEIMAEPARAGELLVRQEASWLVG
ncbi:MAG: UDP-N-acetylmuramoyl-tripeptide--D-alanyl-D-alanine ligase, partial [Patescibacteria group bacterium]